MPILNDTARNTHAADASGHYDKARLYDSGDVMVAEYSPAWAAGATGVQQLAAAVAAVAAADADFDTPGGYLVLYNNAATEEAGPTITYTAGGPGSGAEAIIANDKAVPDGEVFAGKACNLTGLTLTVPAA